MVIQRNWKTQSENNINNVSSSEDSNSSTISSTKGQQQVQKYVTTPQMAENVLARLKQRFGTGLMGQKSCHESEVVMRSLELLRINIQAAFDKEIDTVVKKFLDIYFQPAFKNIKDNLGNHVVSDEIIVKMSCALIENSKSQYTNRTLLTTTSQQQQQQQQCQQQQQLQQYQPSKNILILTKNATTGEEHYQSSTVISKPLTNMVTLKRPSNETQQSLPVMKKPLILQQRIINPNIVTQQRRQIFWNTANITTETRFLLDVQANQAFGFGTDGRERLASKHPELIRYLPDPQDRDWLVQQKIIPSQNRNSRFLFLVHDEVIKLSQSDIYKKRENLNLTILHAFKIPSFIIKKMKIFFIDLNIKSRGLITNSYTNDDNNGNNSGTITNNNNNCTKLIIGNVIETTSSPVITTSNNNVNVNSETGSHLRNALLQRTNSDISTSKDNLNDKTNQQLKQHQQQKLIGTNILTVVKPKSTLSSSHATLTALLNSSNNNSEDN